jgi:hypothetical protein
MVYTHLFRLQASPADHALSLSLGSYLLVAVLSGLNAAQSLSLEPLGLAFRVTLPIACLCAALISVWTNKNWYRPRRAAAPVPSLPRSCV